jgi:hypothetical protein
MQQWTTKTALTFLGTAESSYKVVITEGMFELALKHDSLLYTMYTFSALHIALTATESENKEMAMNIYSKYLDLALQEHQSDIVNIGKQNADVVAVTSSLLRNCSQAVLQDRAIEPYIPPFDWLRMTRGNLQVYRTAWDWIHDDETSIARKTTTRKPDMSKPEAFFQESNGEGLKHLLRRTSREVEEEPWDAEIEAAYKSTICYIGSMQIAFGKDATVDELCRRALAFPMFMSKRFEKLLKDLRPRALVIMAYYFAYLAKLRNIWYIGNTGRREIRGITWILPNDRIWIDMVSLIEFVGIGSLKV